MAIRHTQQVDPHLNRFYWHKEIITTLALICLCLNNKLNSEVPETNGGIFSTKMLTYVSYTIAKVSSKNFSFKKTICNFLIIFVLLYRFMDTNPIEMIDACFWLFKSQFNNCATRKRELIPISNLSPCC
jgi:hypothetical protein